MPARTIRQAWTQLAAGLTRCVDGCATRLRDDRLAEPDSGDDFRRELRRLRALLRDEPSG
jgi:hypothetical protein